MIRKIWFYGWRFAMLVAMLAFTYFRFVTIGNTTKGLIHIGLDLVVIAGISYKLFTSRFCMRSPRQFFASSCNSESKLVNVTKRMLPCLLIFAFGFGLAYKLDFNTEKTLILLCFILFIICLSVAASFIDYCRIKEEKEEV